MNRITEQYGCPQVAGAVALLRQMHPDWTTEQLKAALPTMPKHYMMSMKIHTLLWHKDLV